MKTIRVFVSHAGTDTWVAEQIAAKIRRRGAIPFLDKKEMEVGLHVGNTIFDFIKTTDELLVLFTPWAIERPYIWYELGGAWSQPHRVRIAVILHGVSMSHFVRRSNVPSYLKSLFCVQLNQIDDYFDQLSRRVAKFRKDNKTNKPLQNNKRAEKSKYRIFLSHSKEDVKWVSEFADCLRKKGVIAWFSRSIFPGEEWELGEQGENALIESSHVISIFSSNSLNNPWTYFELGAVYANKKKVLMIFPDEITPATDVPEFVLNFQNLHEKSPIEAAKRVSVFLKSSSQKKPANLHK